MRRWNDTNVPTFSLKKRGKALDEKTT
jgi:hypothetical protein